MTPKKLLHGLSPLNIFFYIHRIHSSQHLLVGKLDIQTWKIFGNITFCNTTKRITEIDWDYPQQTIWKNIIFYKSMVCTKRADQQSMKRVISMINLLQIRIFQLKLVKSFFFWSLFFFFVAAVLHASVVSFLCRIVMRYLETFNPCIFKKVFWNIQSPLLSYCSYCQKAHFALKFVNSVACTIIPVSSVHHKWEIARNNFMNYSNICAALSFPRELCRFPLWKASASFKQQIQIVYLLFS